MAGLSLFRRIFTIDIQPLNKSGCILEPKSLGVIRDRDLDLVVDSPGQLNGRSSDGN